MQISQVPALLPKAFAASGTKNTIPVDSQISVTPGAASLTDGFPPLTMTPLAAGGVPPYGADANGILNWLSQICQWSNAGGVYPYNAAFSAAIGGYPKGALIQKSSGTGYWVSAADNNTTDPYTGGAGWVGFDPSTLQAGSYTTAVDSGSLNALAVTLTPVPTALSAGMQVTTMNVVATNTGAATLNVNGLGVKPIVLPSGAALSGGEIPGGAAATFVYTGASWMLQTRQPANGVPYMNFSQIDALASDQGPIICTDMGGYLYKWTTSPYFTGYRNVRCGNLPETFAAAPRAWELATIGGVWSMSDPKQKRLIAWFQEQGLVVPSGSWLAGQGMIADLGSGNWKGIDLQNMFMRKAGTDADTANAAPAGTYKGDTLKAHTHTLAAYVAYAFSGGGESGMGNGSSTPTSSTGTAETAPKHTRTAPVILV